MTGAISQTTSPFLKSVIATSPNNQTTQTQATAQQAPVQLTPKEEFDRDVFLKEYIKEKEKEGVKASLIQAGTSLAQRHWHIRKTSPRKGWLFCKRKVRQTFLLSTLLKWKTFLPLQKNRRYS